MKLQVLAAWCLTIVCAGPLLADDGLFGIRGWLRSCTRTSDCPCLGGSPDDYCKKCMPKICCYSYGGACDDYCRKSIPCLTSVPHCGGPDDYCRKSMPCLLCPPASPYLYYGPSGGCCTSEKCR